jgi:hypothetical protein
MPSRRGSGARKTVSGTTPIATTHARLDPASAPFNEQRGKENVGMGQEWARRQESVAAQTLMTLYPEQPIGNSPSEGSSAAFLRRVDTVPFPKFWLNLQRKLARAFGTS